MAWALLGCVLYYIWLGQIDTLIKCKKEHNILYLLSYETIMSYTISCKQKLSYRLIMIIVYTLLFDNTIKIWIVRFFSIKFLW